MSVTPRKVLVTGGRDFPYKTAVFGGLNAFHRVRPITHLIHGGCRGVDTLADAWARKYGVQPVRCDANWDFYGNSAGPIRNWAMAALGPDCVIWFPGGTGTLHMRKIADELDIPQLPGIDLMNGVVKP